MGDYTVISQDSPRHSKSCLLQRDWNNDLVYSSMQALVLRTNGFLLDLSSLSLADIDAQTSQESAVVFAFASGELVVPEVRLSNDTLLTATEYVVSPQAVAGIGFPRKHIRVTGAQFGGPKPVDCRFQVERKKGFGRCELRAEFDDAVDTIVILQGVVQKSHLGNETSSVCFVSDLTLRC